MGSSLSKPDGRLHLRVDPELKQWLEAYVETRSLREKRRVKLNHVVEGLIVDLRRRTEQARDAAQL